MSDEKMVLPGADRLRPECAPIARSNILGAALAIGTSLGLFGIVFFVFGPARYARSVDAALGVVTGHPFWKTFQSRVLGPYLVKALSFGSLEHYTAAYIFFQIATVAAAAFLCWRLGRKFGGNDQSALFALLTFVICFVALLSPPWLYSWDLLDIIVFFVFIDFVLSNRPLPWFLALFAVAIWNRDSADFIALWLILDPLVRYVYQRRYKLAKAPLDWRRMLAGAICIVAGLILAAVLKRTLLIQEMAALSPGDTPVTAGNPYNIVLPINIDALIHSFFTARIMIALAFMATAVALGARFARLDPQRYLALYLTELALVVAAVVFGIIYELRIFLVLVPFVVASAVLGLPSQSARVHPA
jgi:hypothetical protein